MKYVIRANEADLDAPLGGKARALAALRAADLSIPAWFVVRPDAFHNSAGQSPSASEVAANDPRWRSGSDIQPSAAVVAELATAIAELCPDGAPVAVRSSASDEDGAQHSFAGQLDSFLFVEPADLPAKVAAARSIWSGGAKGAAKERSGNYIPNLFATCGLAFPRWLANAKPQAAKSGSTSPLACATRLTASIANLSFSPASPHASG